MRFFGMTKGPFADLEKRVETLESRIERLERDSKKEEISPAA